MGMAASQVRLLQLTSRKNTIGENLTCLSLEKNALSRDMIRVSREYQDALNTKMLKWTNNSGATYVELNYNNLMTPNTTNANTPYLLTNSNGQVVVNSQYMDYAMLISPNGAPGGDWESNRTSILSKLTGIPAEQIDNAVTTQSNKDASDNKVNTLQADVDKLKSKCTKSGETNSFLKTCFGSLSSNFNATDKTKTCSIADDYSNSNTDWSLGNNLNTAKISLNTLLDTIKSNVKNYLFDDDYSKFEAACSKTQEEYENLLSADGIDNTQGLCVRKDDSGEYYINANAFISELLKQYESAGGTTSSNSLDSNITKYYYVDKLSDDYKAYEAKLAELEAAKLENSQYVDANNQALTASAESQIAFYDKLFKAIATQGWVADFSVDDSQYLNNMLQNNQYYITTIDSYTDSDGKDCPEYNAHIASNFDYIVSVNDKAVQTEAQAKYEYEKSIINEKESRIDTRMQNLETEQAAIIEMIKGIESVRNDNVEKNFNVFS